MRRGIGQGLWLLSLFIFLTSLTAWGADRTPEEYWNDTFIDLGFVEEYVSPFSCQKDLHHYLACIEALNTLAGFLSPAAEVATPALYAAQSSGSGVLMQNEYFLVVEKLEPETNEGLSSYQIWQNLLQTRDERNAAFTQVYAESSLDTQDVASIEGGANGTDRMNHDLIQTIQLMVRQLGQQLPSPTSEAYVAAQVVNSYLEIAYDPHTYLKPADMVDDEMNRPNSNYVGIGSYIREFGGQFILTPIEGMAAHQAGLYDQDVLTHINSESVEGWTMDQVVSQLRGEADTEVTITVLRNGQTLELTMTRAAVSIPNVATKRFSTEKFNHGYIKVRSFTDGSVCSTTRDAIRSLEQEGVDTLILDLRGNGGGLLSESICMGGLFVGPEVVVQTGRVNQPNSELRRHVAREDQLTQLPVIVLQDAGSASASEILAGALQDHQRAWILGERSFGKATVQRPGLVPRMATPVSMFGGQILMYQTIERFYQPSGRTNQIVGILPDFEVPVRPDATEEERFAMREENLYTNALPPLGVPWEQPRPHEVNRLKNCMDQTGRATERYEAEKAGALPADYQLLVAQDLGNCLVQ